MITMRLIIFFFITLQFVSCSENLDESIENCDAFNSSDIITEEERQTLCIYNKVYEYKSKLYTVCECCLCLKIAPILDCKGNSFSCLKGSLCREVFFEKAEYLFSIKAE